MIAMPILVPFILVALLLPQAKPEAHVDRKIEGWIVHIDKRLTEGTDKPLGDRALRILADRLDTIESRVAADKVAWFQGHVPIWIDLTCGDLVSPQYHPGADWLKEHGYDAKMAKCVQIPSAKYFVGAGFQMHQPLAVLHEMSHAYHDQVLGFDDKEIKDAYDKFKASGKYEKVLRSSGRMERHYGLTNPMEFFAEMTESYFGANDFFPFNQGELKQQEPDIFALMQKIWGRTP